MTDVERRQLQTELAHWRGAIVQLQELDAVAPAEAWAQLEDYLRLRLRDRLTSSIAALSTDGASVASALASGRPLGECRTALLRLRARYLAVESTVEFYGDAVQQRTTPRLGAVLRGLDTIAVDSMEVILRPLGKDVPPALVYPEKGLGAAVLRAGIRLWDQGGLSPVAAIKVTRHNLIHPTAILHETTHQWSHLVGWNTELGEVLAEVAGAASDVPGLGELWRSWAGEVAADVGAFAMAGWSPVPALANVVDGPTASVHRVRLGDPHPPSWLRVLLNVELCRTWYGAGPWDDLGEAWRSRHDPAALATRDAAVARAGERLLPALATACTRRPFRAFGGRPLHALADPDRVSPARLAELSRQAGDTLLTSTFLARSDSLRILALLTSDQPLDPAATAARTARLHDWLARLAPMPLPRAA